MASSQHSTQELAEQVVRWQRLSDSNSNPYSAQSALGEACDVIGGLIEQVQSLELACDHHKMFWQKAEERERGLKEQLQSAERRLEESVPALHREQVARRELQEQLQCAETTLAHAEAFIEHQDMSYRWAEWCEGRDPNPAEMTSDG